jgi:alkyldihydroxyacetonephosphate synthase
VDERAPMAWDGWGDPARRAVLGPGVQRLLRRRLGIDPDADPRSRVRLAAVAVPPSRLPEGMQNRLGDIVGPAEVRTDDESRIRRTGGKGYPDLVRLRRGDAAHAPDAVVRPGSHAQVRDVLEACAEHGVAVVPFGGGTSVVGGVEALRGGFEAAIALDLGLLTELVDVDETSLVATVQPGLRGAELEVLLGERGLTLGHVPQSVQYATVGGFVATRSAGQASTGYGRIDDLVEGLRMATPVGDLRLGRAPASAAGPDLLQLAVGSEGVLGVITEVDLRVRPAPQARRYEGWATASFADGLRAIRALAQEGPAPDIVRLSDEEETAVTLAQVTGAKALALRGVLAARRRRGGCLLVVGYEGTARDVRDRRRAAARLLAGRGARHLGRGVGEAWERHRYEGPYLRDPLMDAGVLVETLETAARWSALSQLYAAVRGALRTALGDPVVLCHVSHLYPTGASLYFTFLAPVAEGEEIARWQAAKEAAGAAIAGVGGTISHHHAVGRDHLPWMAAEVGEVGLSALRAAKAALDPAGICNPGKLLPE